MSSSIKPVLGSQPNLGHFLMPDAGLLLLSEGSGNKALDLSGNNNIGTFVNNTIWVPGKSGSSLYFDGTGDAVNLGIWSGGPKVTFFARVKFEETIGAYEQITAADSSDDGNRTFQLRRDNTGKLNFIVFVGGGANSITGGTTLTTGLWWDIVGVNDGAKIHIFVNGIEDATPVVSGSMDNDPAAWAIGLRAADDGWISTVEELQGQVEFLMRWDTDKIASEIALLHKNPFIMFERDPIELWTGATSVEVLAGAAGIMTPNTGFWGPTF